jgi:hypothetical protein
MQFPTSHSPRIPINFDIAFPLFSSVPRGSQLKLLPHLFQLIIPYNQFISYCSLSVTAVPLGTYVSTSRCSIRKFCGYFNFFISPCVHSKIWGMPTSWMLCRVTLLWADVSVKIFVSIIRVKRIGILSTTLTVTGISSQCATVAKYC